MKIVFNFYSRVSKNDLVDELEFLYTAVKQKIAYSDHGTIIARTTNNLVILCNSSEMPPKRNATKSVKQLTKLDFEKGRN